MSNARLVKRKELLEQEQADPSRVPPSSAARNTVRTMVDWVNSRQATRQPDPREVFAALFIKDTAA
jgi:hypothetical protein